MEAARTAISMVLGIALPLLVQLWDKRRMPEPLRARTWNVATWGGALYAFGPLSMLGWVFVTRRPYWRCLVAVPYTLAPILGILLLDALAAFALGLPSELSVGELMATVGGAAMIIPVVLLFVEGVVLLWRLLRAQPLPHRQWREIARELESAS